MKMLYNGFSFTVKSPWFLESFSAWEPEIKDLYAKYTRPDRSILDIGAWIGPTVFIGFANNARHIYAVEADPINAHSLKENCRLSYIDDRVTIINRCIYPISNEIIQFGEPLLNGGSSTKSLGGRFKVVTATLGDILKDNGISAQDLSIIKIDIEGSELFLMRDLKKLSSQKNFVVFLSLHQLFWKKIPAKPEGITALFDCYDFHNDREEKIGQGNINNYINGNPDCLLVLKPKG